MQRRERSDAELEWLFFLGVCVAGKQAYIIHEKIKDFSNGRTDLFGYVRELRDAGEFESRLRAVKMGKYRIIQACFDELFRRKLNLRTCSIEDLEALPGIGPKTSRFIIGYSRPTAKVAVLDVHLLAFLRENGIDAPRQTPQSTKRYGELEKAYLGLAEQLGIDPIVLDNQIWQSKAKGWKTQ